MPGIIKLFRPVICSKRIVLQLIDGLWPVLYIMKIRPMIFALGLSLLLLSGCVASVGPEYGGYYPPAPRPYYGYARPYYAPRPVYYAPRPYYGYRGRGHNGRRW